MAAAGFAGGVVIAHPVDDLLGERLNFWRHVTIAVSMVTTALVVFDIASRVPAGRWLVLATFVLVPAIVLARIDPFWGRDTLSELLYFYWTGSVLGGLVGLVGGTGERLIRRGPALGLAWAVTSVALIVGFAQYQRFDVPFYVLAPF